MEYTSANNYSFTGGCSINFNEELLNNLSDIEKYLVFHRDITPSILRKLYSKQSQEKYEEAHQYKIKKRETMFYTEYIETILQSLRATCLVYKNYKKLTPFVLEDEYKKMHGRKPIPYKELYFENIVEFLSHHQVQKYIQFCGEPGENCEIKGVVTEKLAHIVNMIESDKKHKRRPGYSYNNRDFIFYMSHDKQWELTNYCLQNPEGVPYEIIEENFIKKYDMYKMNIATCEHLIGLLKHTELICYKGMVFHELYFDKETSSPLYINSDGTVDEIVVQLMKDLEVDFKCS